ncbi:MAG: hypothetical protein RL335_484 [Bacteroidota bacterium]|jgi:phosphonatase-like hydrolase
MNIKMIVSDIAGTTIVDKDYVAIAFIEAFLHEGIDLEAEQIRPLMGFKKTEAITSVLKSHNAYVNEVQVQRIHDSFQQLMIAFYASSKELEPLPGVEEFLEWCMEKKIIVALNSGFPKIIVDVIVDRLGWIQKGWIKSAIASDEVQYGRPHPDMIFELMRRHQIESSTQVLKIGDTMVDIQEGQQAKCGMVVAVSTGAYTHDDLLVYKPDHVINHFSQLKGLIWPS